MVLHLQLRRDSTLNLPEVEVLDESDPNELKNVVKHVTNIDLNAMPLDTKDLNNAFKNGSPVGSQPSAMSEIHHKGLQHSKRTFKCWMIVLRQNSPSLRLA